MVTNKEEDWESQGLDPLTQPRVNLRVEEKSLEFLVDTETQHSVFIKAEGQLSTKKSYVQGATGAKK